MSEPSKTAVVGRLGETFVVDWLLGSQGATIVARRWHSRWGELDVVARLPEVNSLSGRNSGEVLAFVEVKTRSRGNWDADGLLAVTAQKQQKLGQTAQLFLAEHAEYQALPCRFDIALVICRRGHPPAGGDLGQPAIAQPVWREGYQLTLAHYIPGGFDWSDP